MKHPSDSRSLGDPGPKETALGIGQFYHPGRFDLLLCKVLFNLSAVKRAW